MSHCLISLMPLDLAMGRDPAWRARSWLRPDLGLSKFVVIFLVKFSRSFSNELPGAIPHHTFHQH